MNTQLKCGEKGEREHTSGAMECHRRGTMYRGKGYYVWRWCPGQASRSRRHMGYLEVWVGFQAEKGEIQMKRGWYGSRAVTGRFGNG